MLPLKFDVKFIVQDKESALFLMPAGGDVGFTPWAHEAGCFDAYGDAIDTATFNCHEGFFISQILKLGFTTVTYTGVTALVNQLVSIAQNNWATLPTAVLQLVTLAGIPQVLGMIFGAYMARVAMWAAVGAARYVLKT